MPVVRARREIQPAPIPGVRRQASLTPEAAGAGLAEAQARTALASAALGAQVAEPGLRMFARLQQARRDEAEEARRQADILAVLEADNRLADWIRDRVYDPERGALTLKGRDALGLPEQIDADYERVASAIEQSLATDEQRVAFARIRTQRRQDLALDIRRHVAREIQTYTAQELEARAQNALAMAVGAAQDPVRAGKELAAGEQAIRALARPLGLGPEQVEQQVRALRSDALVGIIQRLLAEGQTTAARAYFEEGRDLIAPDKVDDLLRALKAGSLRQQAQRETDRILASGGGLREWRERARAIEDPELRDEVMERLEHEAVVRERLEREAEETRLRQAYDLVDRGVDPRRLPPALWTQLSGSERASLLAYARSRAAGLPVETDWAVYYRLMSLAADDPAAYVTENLYRYRGSLDDSEFKQLVDLQARLKGRDREAAARDLAGYRTKEQILEDTLVQYGIDPRDKRNAAAIAQLRRMLDLRVDAAQAQGVRVTNTEIQRTLDDLLAQQVTVRGSWWHLLPGGKPFLDQQKRLIELTIDDVPAEDRAAIERALRARGLPVSEAAILDLYLERLVRERR
jgi:hypothetical protein